MLNGRHKRQKFEDMAACVAMASATAHYGRSGGKNHQKETLFHGNIVLIKIKLQTMTVQKTETHIQLAYIKSMSRGVEGLCSTEAAAHLPARPGWRERAAGAFQLSCLHTC